MSRVCEKCQRGYNPAVSRSHSNIATLRRQYVNLQYKTVDGKRVRICSRCIKTLAKNARKVK
ncbi:MAG: L28 family ribosomal protein [Patescibacteria group bacterium]